jgi:protein-tyrosine phosphatase
VSGDPIGAAARALREGALAVLRLQGGVEVVASAQLPNAVERLASIPSNGVPPALLLSTPGQVMDWVPSLDRRGRRVCRRAWPGPITLAFRDGVAEGCGSRIDDKCWAILGGRSGVAMRAPGYHSLALLEQFLAGPLIGLALPTEAVPSGFGSGDVAVELGEALPVPRVVLEWNGTTLGIRESGCYAAADIERLFDKVILFVCTGNTCRSPMAAGLCRGFLAHRLGCEVHELSRHGVVVLSAGLAAPAGLPATPEAVRAAAALGADLSDHASQPVTPALLARADYVIAMTRSHLRAVAGNLPYPDVVAEVLRPNGQDVDDPYGGDANIYTACAASLAEAVKARVREWADEWGLPAETPKAAAGGVAARDEKTGAA